MPKVKSNGPISFRGDSKVRVNTELCAEQYNLSCIEDIFISLASGEQFSKVSLVQVYLQMQIEELSNKHLTSNKHCGSFQYNCLVFSVAYVSVFSPQMCVPSMATAPLNDGYFSSVNQHTPLSSREPNEPF